MSERSFFTLRYSLPGFTFLLFLFLICLEEIIMLNKILGSELFIAIFSFFSAPAIGFFVSQVWYIFYYNRFQIYYWKSRCKKEPRIYMEYLHKFKKIKRDPIIAEVVANFIYNHNVSNIRSYVSRRWDLIRIFGSTQCSIFISILFGLFIKIIRSIFNILNNSFNLEWLCSTIFYFTVFVGIGIFLCYAFEDGVKQIEIEHDKMALLLLKQILSDPKFILETMLPKSYFESNSKEEC